MFVATRVNCRSFASLQALEELRRESAEKQATLQEEINRLKREKEEVSNTEEILISDYAGNNWIFPLFWLLFSMNRKFNSIERSCNWLRSPGTSNKRKLRLECSPFFFLWDTTVENVRFLTVSSIFSFSGDWGKIVSRSLKLKNGIVKGETDCDCYSVE